jgi:hypothetical protein
MHVIVGCTRIIHIKILNMLKFISLITTQLSFRWPILKRTLLKFTLEKSPSCSFWTKLNPFESRSAEGWPCYSTNFYRGHAGWHLYMYNLLYTEFNIFLLADLPYCYSLPLLVCSIAYENSIQSSEVLNK